jgi:hypothetical protein
MDHTTLRMLDEATGDEVQRCTGPLPDGSCPRVEIGDILPCAGYALVPEAAAGTQAYAVSGRATLCPVTLAAAIAIPSDQPFIPDD